MTPKALFWLGWHFGRRLLARALGLRGGIRRFERNYVQGDRLLPISANERASLAALGRCIACGQCDVRFDAWDRVDRKRFDGPSRLPLSYTRGLVDDESLGPYLEELRKGDLVALERICPTGVPFRQLAQFAEERGRQMRELTSQQKALTP